MRRWRQQSSGWSTAHERDSDRAARATQWARKSKTVLIASAGAVAVLAIAPACGWHARKATSDAVAPRAVVATINGAPITAEELQIFIDRDRSNVLAGFAYRFHLTVTGSSFWTRTYGGQRPGDILKRIALLQAEKVKLQQEMMVASGVLANDSIAAFDRALKIDNARRAAAVRAGQVIYGPITYRKDDYYDYLFTNGVAQLKRSLVKGPLKFSPAQLRAFFERNKAKYTRPPTPIIAYAFVPGPKVTAAGLAALAATARAIKHGAPLKEAAKRVTGATARVVTLDQEGEKVLYGTDPVFVRALAGLRAGEETGVVEGVQGAYVAEVLSVKPGTVPAFASIEGAVSSDFITVLYDRLVANRMAAAVIHVHEGTLSRLAVG